MRISACQFARILFEQQFDEAEILPVAVCAKDCDARDGGAKLCAIQRQGFLIGLIEQPGDIRVLSCEQRAGQSPPAHLKEQTVFRRLNLNFTCYRGEQFGNDAEAGFGNEQRDCFGLCHIQSLHTHQPMPVGGNHTRTIRAERELRAFESVLAGVRIFARGKNRRANHRRQRFTRHRQPEFIGFRCDRKIIRRGGVQAKAAAIAFHCDALSSGGKMDRLFRQLPHDLIELACGQTSAAFGQDNRFYLTTQTVVEAARRQRELVTFSLQQQVVIRRKCRLRLDDFRQQRQFREQGVTIHLKFHSGLLMRQWQSQPQTAAT